MAEEEREKEVELQDVEEEKDDVIEIVNLEKEEEEGEEEIKVAGTPLNSEPMEATTETTKRKGSPKSLKIVVEKAEDRDSDVEYSEIPKTRIENHREGVDVFAHIEGESEARNGETKTPIKNLKDKQVAKKELDKKLLGQPQRKLSYLLSFWVFGFFADIVLCYMAYSSLGRYFREVYYFSLTATGLSAVSLTILIFFIPAIDIFQPIKILFSKWWLLVPPLILINLFFILNLIPNMISKTITSSLLGISFMLWFDIRLQSPQLCGQWRQRFIQANFLGIAGIAILRYWNFSVNPIYETTLGVGLTFLVLAISSIYIIIELARFDIDDVFANYIKLSSREYTRQQILMVSPFSKAVDPTNQKALKRKETIRNLITSIISGLFWSLGFGVLTLQLIRFCTNSYSASRWVGLPNHPFGVFIILSFLVGGTLLPLWEPLNNPIVLFIFSQIILWPFVELTSPYTQFIFGCAFSALLGLYLQFYLVEAQLIPWGNWFGLFGFSSFVYVIAAFSQLGIVVPASYFPTGYLFFQREWLVNFLAMLVVSIGTLCTYVNRLHYFIRFNNLNYEVVNSPGPIKPNIEKEETFSQLRCLYQMLLFPQLPGRENIVRIQPSSDNEEINMSAFEMDEESGVKTTSIRGGAKRFFMDFFTFRYLKIPLIIMSVVFIILFLLPAFAMRQFFRAPIDYTHGGSSTTLRVATWNVYQGYDIYGGTSLSKLAEFIRNAKVDYIGIQEAEPGRIQSDFIGLTEYVADHARMHFYDGLPLRDASLNAAALSHIPFDSTEAYAMQVTQSDTMVRPLLRTSFTVNNVTVTIICVHVELKYSPVDARAQIEQIIALGNETASKHPTIILGDFNYEADHEFISLIKSAGFKSSFETYSGKRPITYSKFGDTESIDWVFYKSPIPFSPINAYTVDTNGTSDHLPLFVDFAFK